MRNSGKELGYETVISAEIFSWFDSYDIYDEDGNTVYVVKGSFPGDTA